MQGKTKSFKELIVWQKAHVMVLDIYMLTKLLPKEELFGLTSQIRRSAVSVAANIAEGYRRKGKQDKVRLLNIAQASLEETNYYLILINDLKYGNVAKLERICEEVGKMLNKYTSSILASNS